MFLGAGGKRVATEALQRRAGCTKGRERWVGTWPVRGGESQSKRRCDAARLGRRCAASARDLFGLPVDSHSHVNALSSRKLGNGHPEQVEVVTSENSFTAAIKLPSFYKKGIEIA